MTVMHPEVTEKDPYLSIEQVCELVPGMTRATLANLRYRGEGPRYRKISARKVCYLRSELIDWIESTARQGTSDEAMSA